MTIADYIRVGRRSDDRLDLLVRYQLFADYIALAAAISLILWAAVRLFAQCKF